MHLVEERLVAYQRYRQTAGGEDPASGLSLPGQPTVDTVKVDLQQDSRLVFTDDSGNPTRSGHFIGFSYDELRPGDQLDTPHGRLEVVSAYLWSDEEPSHYESSLRVVS